MAWTEPERDGIGAAILEDHRRGIHEEWDTDDGCRYPGCDDAFWEAMKDDDGSA
jgi:hypothetical protein